MGTKQAGGYRRNNGLGRIPEDTRTTLNVWIPDAKVIKEYATNHGMKIVALMHEIAERLKDDR